MPKKKKKIRLEKPDMAEVGIHHAAQRGKMSCHMS